MNFRKYKVIKIGKTAYKILYKGQIMNPLKITDKLDKLYPKIIKKDKLQIKINKWRQNKSKELNIASYMLISDVTVLELVKKKPKNVTELIKISGMTMNKIIKYGDDILKIINNKISDSESITSSEEVKVYVKKKVNTEMKTYLLYKENLTLKEIAKKRGLTIYTIQKHIVSLIKNKKDINIYKYVKKEDYNKIKNVLETTEYTSLKEIKQKLKKNTYFQIRIVKNSI